MRFASGEAELRAYLGDKYRDQDEAELIRQWNRGPREQATDIEDFYRKTDAYLYDLTKWHASNRYPYSEVVAHFARRHGLKHLLEFGCGIGGDGLKLLEWGFQVTFYDFRNPSTDYLKWRLQRRGCNARVLHVGEDELPPNDLTFAVDVIEHLVNPAQTLAEIARHTRAIVPHIPITMQQHKYPMHFHLDRRALRKVIREQGFRRARDFSFLRYKSALTQLWEAPEFWVRN